MHNHDCQLLNPFFQLRGAFVLLALHYLLDAFGSFWDVPQPKIIYQDQSRVRSDRLIAKPDYVCCLNPCFDC